MDWNRLYVCVACERAVTPCVGVWIETIFVPQIDATNCCHTLRGCVDWNFWFEFEEIVYCVTPCVGVWIETEYPCSNASYSVSHPAWVCGLKLHILLWSFRCVLVTPCVGVWIETLNVHFRKIFIVVTPCVGVWIETYASLCAWSCAWSHPAWVCGLKRCHVSVWLLLRGSHPAWVCGLKPRKPHNSSTSSKSHPAWVCGLKHRIASKRGGRFRHTLRGCIWIEALFTRWSSLWKNCKHSASCVFLFKLL